MPAWEVFKFGGTSVSSAANYLKCADIVLSQMKSLPSSTSSFAVVVSAMGGKPKTTDLLLNLVKSASGRRNDEVEEGMRVIREKHLNCINELGLGDEERDRLTAVISADLKSIQDVLRTVSLMKWNPAKISSLVAGYGEIWSGQILTSVFNSLHPSPTIHTTYCDARQVITVDETADDTVIEWSKSRENLAKYLEATKEGGDNDSGTRRLLCVTGFVASNTEGVATTLGRDGSDYSASIFGNLLSASSVTIWTDVDGVLSADPRRVPNSLVLPEVSFSEAMELAYFGAKVIHPKTMQPALLASPPVPIWIRNTFNPNFRGTRIYTTSTTHKQRDRCVCGFASIDSVAILNVEGSGMVGVKGVALRLFGSLEESGVSVILIAQASSEHSISLALQEGDAMRAKAILEETFSRELKHGHISSVTVQSPCSVIAAVGDGMSNTTGVAGRFFRALGESKINVLAIAQGLSERNISAVVPGSDATRALRAVHAAFRLSQTSVRVGLVVDGAWAGGVGVGRTLLKLLQKQRTQMMISFDIDVQVVCVMAEGELLWAEDGGSISDTDWTKAVDGQDLPKGLKFESSSSAPSLHSAFTSALLSSECGHNIVFDCTASEEISKQHPGWLKNSVTVITANNTGVSGSEELREELDSAEQGLSGVEPGRYLKEVCVGGSLPILKTINDLMNSGDRIKGIEGLFSVSFSHIMHRVSPPPKDDGTVPEGIKFSEAVKEAIDLGMMEVDPAKDLNNEYTARCLMVLVRELSMGDQWSKDRIIQQSEQLLKMGESWDESTFAAIDAIVAEKHEKAKASKCCLRHVSSMDVGESSIKIRFMECPYNHVFAINPPTCLCVRIFTQTHHTYPLIVSGQAEGLSNTASALLAEMINMMSAKVTARSRSRRITRTNSSVGMGKSPSSPTLDRMHRPPEPPNSI